MNNPLFPYKLALARVFSGRTGYWFQSGTIKLALGWMDGVTSYAHDDEEVFHKITTKPLYACASSKVASSVGVMHPWGVVVPASIPSSHHQSFGFSVT
jgi:hypothetical protein